jgi:hypothetical protein
MVTFWARSYFDRSCREVREGNQKPGAEIKIMIGWVPDHSEANWPLSFETAFEAERSAGRRTFGGRERAPAALSVIVVLHSLLKKSTGPIAFWSASPLPRRLGLNLFTAENFR